MKRLFAVICIVLLFSGTFSIVNAQSNTPSIDLAGFSWNKTTLHALTITNESQSWWQSTFVTLTQRAVMQWNQAIQYFASNYTDYAYMGIINIVLDVSNQTLPGYDIYISFLESVPLGGSDALGLTTTIPYPNGTIRESLVNLSSKGTDLTNSNQRDVCDHELGHALGLGHSNSSSDIMYPYYDLYSSGEAISTLDLYGLATCFRWLNLSEDSTANNQLPQYVVLPSNIPFTYAPVTNPTPKSLGDNPVVRTLKILLGNPYTAGLLVVLLVFLVVAGLVFMWMRRRRPKV